MARKSRLLLLPGGGFSLFIVGTLFPLHYTTFRNVFMICGAVMTLLFYFITLFHVLKAFSRDPDKKIFWLIAIICVPVVGNIIYIIFLEMANRWQKPHGVW